MKARAPLRISFAGGGTDIEPYVSDYGSYILSAGIKLYARALYTLNYVPQNSVEQMLSQMVGKGGVRITNDALPMSGLGASASCFVAGAKSIYPNLDKEQIARLAFYLERKVMGIVGGIQDQYCSAYGGVMFLIMDGQSIEVQQMSVLGGITEHLLLVYCGERKISGDEIIKDQMTRYDTKSLHYQKQIAREMRDCLIGNNPVEFGRLLNEAWLCKRKFSHLVSNQDIDDFYDVCLHAGAIGGTLTGAGAGGYMLLMDNPESEGELRQNLLSKGIHYQNVEVDFEGVKVVS